MIEQERRRVQRERQRTDCKNEEGQRARDIESGRESAGVNCTVGVSLLACCIKVCLFTNAYLAQVSTAAELHAAAQRGSLALSHSLC